MTKEEVIALCAVQGWKVFEVTSVNGDVFWVEIKKPYELGWLGKASTYNISLDETYTEAYERALINYNRENQ